MKSFLKELIDFIQLKELKHLACETRIIADCLLITGNMYVAFDFEQNETLPELFIKEFFCGQGEGQIVNETYHNTS